MATVGFKGLIERCILYEWMRKRDKQAGTRPGGRNDMRSYRIITGYYKMKYFRWWNIFDDMCSGPLIIFVLVSRKLIHFDENIREKRFSHFRSQWPWPLTFDLKFAALVTLMFPLN